MHNEMEISRHNEAHGVLDFGVDGQERVLLRFRLGYVITIDNTSLV